MDTNSRKQLLQRAQQAGYIKAAEVFKINMASGGGKGVITSIRQIAMISEKQIGTLLEEIGIPTEHQNRAEISHTRTPEDERARLLPLRTEGNVTIYVSDDPTSGVADKRAKELQANGHTIRVAFMPQDEFNALFTASTPLPESANKLINAGLISEDQARDLAQRHPDDLTAAAMREHGLSEADALGAAKEPLITGAIPHPPLINRNEALRYDAVGARKDGQNIILTARPEQLPEIRRAFPNEQVGLTTAAELAELTRAAYPAPQLNLSGIGSRRPRDLNQILLELGHITPDEQNHPEVELIARKRISEEDWAQAISKATGRPYLNPEVNPPSDNVSNTIPEQIIRTNVIYPHSLNEAGVLQVLMTDPRNRSVIRMINSAAGQTISPVVATESSIRRMISTRLDRTNSIQALQAELKSKRPAAQETRNDTPMVESGITRIVDQILREAIENEASDIHINPTEKGVKVRYRVDGKLEEVMTLPVEGAQQLSARLKIMARLDVTEHRLPQDGRIKFRTGPKEVELRFSSMPIPLDTQDTNGDMVDAENIVMRILNKDNVPDLDKLGFNDVNYTRITGLMDLPYGIILITGPTGSGKTTTGNSALKRLATPDKNILTIEDPIEYRIQGVVQSQVNIAAKLTFARALRAFLRQDPDIIYVGEIRDTEVAKMALEAAMTGHLVIATLHTNNAAGVISRLEEMQVERFNITASLAGVVAQRLVRRLCNTCKNEQPIKDEARLSLEREGIEVEPGTVVWSPTGLVSGEKCPECRGRGYKGRVGIHEVLVMNRELQDAVGEGRPVAELNDIAVKTGMITMREDGLLKSQEGITSIYEVLSQTSESQ